MATVKLGLSKLNAEETVLKAVTVVEHMTGNVYFPTPDPTLATIEAAKDALGAAITASQNGDSEQIALRKIHMAVLKALLKQLAVYVQDESKGDAVKILSSGFEIIVRGGPIGALPAPGNLTAKTGGIIGTADLYWNKLKGARAYIIEKTTADPAVEAGWAVHGYSTKGRYTATGLTTGQVCWFRVLGIGAAGVGAQSDPVRCVAQ